MMGSDGEGGLGVGLSFVEWDVHELPSYEEALRFYIDNRERTDNYGVHISNNKFLVFLRKEDL